MQHSAVEPGGWWIRKNSKRATEFATVAQICRLQGGLFYVLEQQAMNDCEGVTIHWGWKAQERRPR